MYKALIDFCGVVSMNKGDVKVISDKSIVAELLRVGYIEEIKPPEKKQAPPKVKKNNPKKGE